MNIRCTYCQNMFTVGRLEKLAALQKMQSNAIEHYDAHCPRCRRANSVSRQKLEMFTPAWQEGLKGLEQEVAQMEKEMAGKAKAMESAQSAPVEKKAPARPVVTAKSATTKPATAKPAAKKPSAAKPVAKKPAAKKPVAKKPAAKKPAAKAKTKK